jgi:subtilase family serine protease
MVTVTVMNACSIAEEQPDIIVSEFKITAYTKDLISYDYALKNIGNSSFSIDNQKTYAFIHTFYSKTDKFNKDESIPSKGRGSLPENMTIEPGETFHGSYVAHIGNNDLSVWKYLIFKLSTFQFLTNINPEKFPLEANEDNNTAIIPIEIELLPDLKLQDVLVTAYTDETVSYSCAIKNQGLAPLEIGPDNPLVITTYFEQGARIHDTEVLLVGQYEMDKVVTIAPGTTYRTLFTLTHRYKGKYNASSIVILDEANTIVEMDEQNNRRGTLTDENRFPIND